MIGHYMHFVRNLTEQSAQTDIGKRLDRPNEMFRVTCQHRTLMGGGVSIVMLPLASSYRIHTSEPYGSFHSLNETQRKNTVKPPLSGHLLHSQEPKSPK